MNGMSGLAHVGVFVKDVEVSKAFYTQKLDFAVDAECAVTDPDGSVTRVCFVRNANLLLELVQKSEYEARAEGPVDHVALHVEGIETVMRALNERGIVFDTETYIFHENMYPHGTKWIKFFGPDGEILELTEVMQA